MIEQLNPNRGASRCDCSGIHVACRYGQSQATPGHCQGSQSSALKHVENPSQRLGIDLRIDPYPSPVTKVDLDQTIPGGR